MKTNINISIDVDLVYKVKEKTENISGLICELLTKWLEKQR